MPGELRSEDWASDSVLFPSNLESEGVKAVTLFVVRVFPAASFDGARPKCFDAYEPVEGLSIDGAAF